MAHAEKHVIIGIHVINRIQHVRDVQAILTQYGCSIRTRLGLHETDEKCCSPNGLILLEMYGDENEYKGMLDELRAIDGIEAKTMEFAHS